MLDDVVTQTKIHRRVIEWPALRYDGTEFVQEGILPRRLVYIHADDLLALAFEDPQFPPRADRIFPVGTTPATNIEDDGFRAEQGVDPNIEGDCSVDTGEASELGLGIVEAREARLLVSSGAACDLDRIVLLQRACRGMVVRCPASFPVLNGR